MESAAALQHPPVTPTFVRAPVDRGRTVTAAGLVRVERLVDEHRYEDALAAGGGVQMNVGELMRPPGWHGRSLPREQPASVVAGSKTGHGSQTFGFFSGG